MLVTHGKRAEKSKATEQIKEMIFYKKIPRTLIISTMVLVVYVLSSTA